MAITNTLLEFDRETKLKSSTCYFRPPGCRSGYDYGNEQESTVSMSDRSSCWRSPRLSPTTKRPGVGSRSVSTPSPPGKPPQGREAVTVGCRTGTSLLGQYAKECNLAASRPRSILRSPSKLNINLDALELKAMHRHMYSKLPIPITNRNYVRQYPQSTQGSRIAMSSPKSANSSSNTPITIKRENDPFSEKRVSFSNHVRVLTFRKVEDDKHGVLEGLPRAWISKGWTHWQKPCLSRIGRRCQENMTKNDHESKGDYVRCYEAYSEEPWFGVSHGDSSRRGAVAQPGLLRDKQQHDETECQLDAAGMRTCTTCRSRVISEPAAEHAVVMPGSNDESASQSSKVGDGALAEFVGISAQPKGKIHSTEGRTDEICAASDLTPKPGPILSITLPLPPAIVDSLEKTYSKTFSFLLKYILVSLVLTIV
ncbi:hypothetical protein V1517DRAFT_329302 [Lipomyces orientalis]|uniref:Uncharacterized protein n=1 Tax=Lipomyces orientalis TaxID=1233043 RepID=A0ACC3THU1_9ASCO